VLDNLDVNSSDYWDSYDTPSGWDLDSSNDVTQGSANHTLSYCGNITGATSNLCTITDTNTYNSSVEMRNAVNITGAYYNFNVSCQNISGSASDLCTLTDTTGGNSTMEIRDAVNISAQYDFYASDLICNDRIDGTEIAELTDADISNTLTASTWDGETSQADLNVNSSNYWDALDSPSDINAADITDDDTYATTASSETFDENIAFAKNITLGDNDYICFGDSSDACLHWNGSAFRLE